MLKPFFISSAVFAVIVLALYMNDRPSLTEPAVTPQASNATTTPEIPKQTVPIQNPKAEIKTAGHSVEVMAWIYPGSPACGAVQELKDGRKIDVLKPEYFMLGEEGELLLLTEKDGCNGYSAGNVATLKKFSKEQYATISSSYAVSMDKFLTEALNGNDSIDRLVSFVVDNKMTGIEIDFEDFGGWSAESYARYKQFVSVLGKALHGKGKKLMIDGPATSNQEEENWFVWRYADFENLPVDRIVVMIYDYQYDQGVGEPISPLTWIQSTITWTLKRFPHKDRLTVGIPSYGYRGTVGTPKFALLTFDQIRREPGFSTAERDPVSFEMTWRNGNNVYFYQDKQSIDKKIATAKSFGISSVSIWHLGGNPWFSQD